MIALMWNVSTAIRGYLRYYMPTNIVLDLIRGRRGLKWGVPVALVLAPAYLYAASVAATVVNQGGPGWLNVLVLLFAWNAMKFAAMGAWSVCLVGSRFAIHQLRGVASRGQDGGVESPSEM